MRVARVAAVDARAIFALVEGAAGLLRRAAHGAERRGDVPEHERGRVVLEPEPRRPHAPDAALQLPERGSSRRLRALEVRADALQFLEGARGGGVAARSSSSSSSSAAAAARQAAGGGDDGALPAAAEVGTAAAEDEAAARQEAGSDSQSGRTGPPQCRGRCWSRPA